MNKIASLSDCRVIIVGAALATFLLLASFCGCTNQQSADSKPEADFGGLRSVCQLATLKTYYHNVATVNVEASGPLAGFLNTGYKRIWIEYDGTVDFGIDANQVTISQPNDQGEVEVHLPEITILNDSLDVDSINAPITEAGFLTSITAEEKMAGIAAAQENMRATASQNQSLYTQAYDRARRTIAGYVENVGKSIGEEYTVKWV